MAKKRNARKDYIFKGSVSREGVEFYITADSLEEAQERAKRGDYDDYDDRGAETVNWEIEYRGGEVNE